MNFLGLILEIVTLVNYMKLKDFLINYEIEIYTSSEIQETYNIDTSFDVSIFFVCKKFTRIRKSI